MTLSKISAFILLGVILFFGLTSSDKQYLYAKNNLLCGIYCNMTVNYEKDLKEHSFDRYYFQKSLGSFAVNQVFTFSHIKLTPRSANVGLEVFSALALIIAFFMWNAVAKKMQLTPTFYWFGFVALFCNQIFIKLVPYAEDSPDTLAFTLGVWLILAMVRNRLASLYVIFSLALFVQPQLALLIVPLIILWRIEQHVPQPLEKAVDILSPIKRKLLWAVEQKDAANYLIFGFYLILFLLAGYVIPLVMLPYEGLNNLMFYWLPLSALLASALMTYALKKLEVYKTALSFVSFLSDRVVLKRLLLLAFLWGVKGLVVGYFARGPVMSGTSTFYGALQVLYTFQFHAIEQPLKPWLAHFIFYGPVLLWVIYYWPRFVEVCQQQKYGSGCLLTLVCIMAFSTDAESRHFVAFLPLLLLFILYAMNTISAPLFSFFVLGTLLASRFWGTYASISPDVDPWLYTWGPWWTVEMYHKALLVSLAALVSLGCVILVTKRKNVSLQPEAC